MPRSIWNGVVSFGMVSIPVKLYAATESKDISFNLLHRECNSRLKQLRWCPVCDREVDWGEVVRGYQYARDHYVVMTEEDFEKLPLPSKHTVELVAFVKAQEIDPVFYEKSYYLEPEETGVKPFALLMRALREKELTAVAKIAIRNKERLCALRPLNGTLMLETLLHPDEIRVEMGIEVPEMAVSQRELDMAFALIDLLSEPFEADNYRDEYREALMETIEAKLQGEEVAEAPAAPVAKVTDLMTALKASVEAARKRKQEEPALESGRRRRHAAAG
jgi:DNA end-binding protein Ku